MPRAGLTRERVVAGAASVADEVGLDGLTLARVAQRFDVTLPSLYRHVDGIEGVRRDLAVLGMSELANVLARAAAGRSRGDALDAVSRAYRDFATRRPGLYAATMRAPDGTDPELQAAGGDALGVVLAVMRGYGIEGPGAVHAIRIFRSALHGFVAQEEAGSFGLPEDVEESYRMLIDLFDRSFTAWPEEPPRAR